MFTGMHTFLRLSTRRKIRDVCLRIPPVFFNRNGLDEDLWLGCIAMIRRGAIPPAVLT